MKISFYKELAGKFDESGNVTQLINKLLNCNNDGTQIEINALLHEEFYRIRTATYQALPIFGEYGYIYLKHHLLCLSPIWLEVDDQSIQFMDRYRMYGMEQSHPKNYYAVLSTWIVTVMDFYLKLLKQ